MVEGRQRRKQVSRCRCLRAGKECVRGDGITNGSITENIFYVKINQARLKYNGENVFKDGKE
jgi:hypothetical protein